MTLTYFINIKIQMTGNLNLELSNFLTYQTTIDKEDRDLTLQQKALTWAS
jgi:hypothetical protein